MFRQSRFCLSVLNQFTINCRAGRFTSISKITPQFVRFAGHSKWANIKHTKALKDGQKAKVNEKFSRMVRIAIQDGGGVTNPALNSYLRTAMDQAAKLNVPLATLNNQIKKYNANDAQLKRYFLEIKTMNRIFLICEVYTENFAGLKQTVNTAMRKAGQTSFADVKHIFDEVGYVRVSLDETFSNASEFEDRVTEHAIECDAQEVEDIDFETKSATFICRPIEIEKVKRILLNLGYIVDIAEHIFIPQSTIQQVSEAEKKTYESLKQKLSQIDGYENLYDNIEHDST